MITIEQIETIERIERAKREAMKDVFGVKYVPCVSLGEHGKNALLEVAAKLDMRVERIEGIDYNAYQLWHDGVLWGATAKRAYAGEVE